jgi:hypothetical protein
MNFQDGELGFLKRTPSLGCTGGHMAGRSRWRLPESLSDFAIAPVSVSLSLSPRSPSRCRCRRWLSLSPRRLPYGVPGIQGEGHSEGKSRSCLNVPSAKGEAPDPLPGPLAWAPLEVRRSWGPLIRMVYAERGRRATCPSPILPACRQAGARLAGADAPGCPASSSSASDPEDSA